MERKAALGEIMLEYGGNVVLLRPSLRAAMRLERLHGGFPELLRKIEEFDTRTIWHVITTAGGMEASEPLFGHAAAHSLGGFRKAAQGPCVELVAAFIPESKEDPVPADGGAAQSVPWADLFQQLFGYATGWLGWTPEAAWTATPQEIIDAFDAHLAKLKAIYGEAEREPTFRTIVSARRTSPWALIRSSTGQGCAP